MVNVTHSVEKLSGDYHNHRRASPNDDMPAFVKKLAATGLGVQDISADEVNLLVNHPENAPYSLADMVSRRAQTGWTTHGHSGSSSASMLCLANNSIGVDVNIYTSDKEAASSLIGNHENTEVGNFLRDYLEVDVDQITKELNARGYQFDKVDANGVKMSWLGPIPAEGQRLDGQDHIDHYQGDFKKHKRCEMCAI